MNIEKLYPVCKNYLWGGDALIKKYGKKSVYPAAESWELSFHKDGESTLGGGETLAKAARAADLGKNASDFSDFPLLIKLIDAKDDLSVQVHPSDEYALKNENSLGKTEMWYIVEAEEGAGIYLGFKRDVSIEEVRLAIAEDNLTSLLNFYPVAAGESYFIPAGTVHAIGRGCLICEVQQNSNITYRVFDWGRRDKDGNPRALHIDKALSVMSLSAFKPKRFPCDILGASAYFTVKGISVQGKTEIYADSKSFLSLTCVRGEGSIGNEKFALGDTYFVPANKRTTLSGEMEIIMANVRKYYIGIDLGGTFIKGGVVDDLGKIICSDKVPTESEKGPGRVAKNIASLMDSLILESGLSREDIVGCGMGVPGMIDSTEGVVVYSNNLRWENFRIAEEVEALTGIKVRIANDANVAALGETKFGSGKEYKNTVFLTLGTGVGGGIVIDGKLYEGNRSAGAEIGHIVICAGGEECSCGRRGCLEAYASATALIRDTKRAMQENKNSKMWEIGSLDAVSGKTAFDYMEIDESAKHVVERYIYMLGVGIANIANELRPEAIILGGGVCAQGDNLIRPLKARLDEEIYAGKRGPEVKLLIASLENSAGTLGAAALWM